jgi:hypothetical protein
MASKTTGYVQAVDGELADVSYIKQQDKLFEQVIKQKNVKALKLRKN